MNSIGLHAVTTEQSDTAAVRSAPLHSDDSEVRS
jgi:hypothetical protein